MAALVQIIISDNVNTTQINHHILLIRPSSLPPMQNGGHFVLAQCVNQNISYGAASTS